MNYDSWIRFYKIEKYQGPKEDRVGWDFAGEAWIIYEATTAGNLKDDVKCKLRLGPRYFQKLYVKEPESIWLYYFSHETGGYLMRPSIEEKGSFVKVDVVESVNQIIWQANEGEMTKAEQEDLQNLRDVIVNNTSFHADIVPGEQSFYRQHDSWADWSMTHYQILFKRDSFFIEDQETISISVDCHFTSETEEQMLRSLADRGDCSRNELLALIRSAQKVEWKLRCQYYDCEQNLQKLVIDESND